MWNVTYDWIIYCQDLAADGLSSGSASAMSFERFRDTIENERNSQ